MREGVDQAERGVDRGANLAFGELPADSGQEVSDLGDHEPLGAFCADPCVFAGEVPVVPSHRRECGMAGDELDHLVEHRHQSDGWLCVRLGVPPNP